MSGTTYFVQECPTCGRRLEVPITLLGKIVQCRHCHGRFEAIDPETQSPSLGTDSELLLSRAEELLTTIEQSRPRPK